MKTRFSHNCSGCIFIGQSKNGKYDFWYCAMEAGGPTLVGRYGDAGPDYASTLIENLERDGAGSWLEAMKLWAKMEFANALRQYDEADKSRDEDRVRRARVAIQSWSDRYDGIMRRSL